VEKTKKVIKAAMSLPSIPQNGLQDVVDILAGETISSIVKYLLEARSV
jgi:hypothetical protein